LPLLPLFAVIRLWNLSGLTAHYTAGKWPTREMVSCEDPSMMAEYQELRADDEILLWKANCRVAHALPHRGAATRITRGPNNFDHRL